MTRRADRRARGRARRSSPAASAVRSRGREALLLLVPLTIALVWRLAYLQRLGGTPLANTLRGDEMSYWDWSSYLLEHSFRGTNPFFQGPLYPYTLAFTRLIVGSTPYQALIAQAFWGAAAVALLADAIRRTAGSVVAAVVGSILAVNTMWVFFDGLILSESLLLFFESLLLWLWSVQCTARRSALVGACAVLTIGLLAQGRAIAAVLMIPQLLLVRDLARRRHRPWLVEAAVSIGIFVATAIPSAVWNYSRTGSFMPFTYNGGMNFYIGNNPRADGRYAWIDGARLMGTAHADSPDGGAEMDGREYLAKEQGLELSAQQSSDYWTRRAFAYASSHPRETAKRAGYKVMLMLNRAEAPQIEHLGSFQQLAGPVGVPYLGAFLVVAVAGLAGALYASRGGPFGRAVRGYLVSLVLVTTPFFVTDRYRIHLVPALAVLAAIAVVELAKVLRQSPSRETLRFVLAGVGALGLVCMPLRSYDQKYEDWLGTSDLGLRWLEAGDASRAIVSFREAAQSEAGLTGEALANPDVRKDRAKLHFNYGVALRRVAGNSAALPEWEAAATLDPSSARYLRTLADAYRLLGRSGEADSLLVLARQQVGGDAEVAVSEGFRAARERRFDDAAQELERAVSGDTRLYGAWGALIRVRVHQQRLDAAENTLRRAEAAGLPRNVAIVYQGLLAAKRGDTLAAKRALDEAEGTQMDPTLEEVKRWIRDLIGQESARVSSPM